MLSLHVLMFISLVTSLASILTGRKFANARVKMLRGLEITFPSTRCRWSGEVGKESRCEQVSGQLSSLWPSVAASAKCNNDSNAWKVSIGSVCTVQYGRRHDAHVRIDQTIVAAAAAEEEEEEEEKEEEQEGEVKTEAEEWPLPLRVPPALESVVGQVLTRSNGRRTPRQRDNPDNDIERLPPVKPGVYSCGHKGNEVFINFINPSFPGEDSAPGGCAFKVLVERKDVCQVTPLKIRRDENIHRLSARFSSGSTSSTPSCTPPRTATAWTSSSRCRVPSGP